MGDGFPRGFRALLTEPCWAALVQDGHRRHHGAGDVLLRQGEAGGRVLLCLSGRVKVVYAEPDGREVVVAVRGPGHLLGEFSVRDGHPRSATVRTIEPGLTSTLSDQRFNELVGRLGITEQLHSYILGKVRESASHLWQHAHRTTGSRLAGFLEALVDVAGPDHPQPTTIAMSQDELASALGAARSSVTQVVREWREAGLIRTARGRVLILDRAAIRAIAVSDTGQSEW
ncbi:Crp/Fnr family transcriptional regulator [Saccharopolyspora sp. MS10]|uniref:Crp/Fnr family transcriptional regulator n=1 Tax=Saccharopolyspora sp. MS10 TaxID=3385973 RepID=UPI0039A1EECB